MTLLNVDGYSNLKKDPSSGGVVNVDKRGYKAYLENKRLALQQYEENKSSQEQVSTLQDEINTMKGEMSEIKSLLIKLLEKGN